MRLVTISVLSVFVALPALADVRLPVVNLASGGVSARAAFGEPIVKSTPVARTGTEKSVTLAQETNKKTEVIKPESEPVSARATSIDRGEQIVASADILAPRRPSSDLWAHAGTSAVDMPLRLPNPSEFSVIRSDAMLPEESLNDTPVRTAVASTPTHDIMPSAAPLSELDAQIARLNELQQRADASVSDDARVATAAPRSVVPRPTVARPAASHTESGTHTTKIASVRQNNASDTDVNLSRMVVPMDDDVIVRAVEKSESPRIASVRNDMTGMSPSELRRAFRKTFLSENKHLSTFQIDDRFDVASDMTENAAGFTSARDLSETGDIRPLEIKIKFRNDDSALSRDNYTLLTEYASIILSNPTRAVQVSIPQSATVNSDDRKLAARRLAIVEQVLRDNGISEQRILPVLSQRDEEGLVLRMISLDQYETLTKQQRDIFGDTVSKKTYRSMSW